MRGRNQKLKLLYLAKIMQDKTDDTHYLTMPEIIAELGKYDIEAQRKSVYDDLSVLDDFGIEIIKEQIGSKTYYHCGAREFEPPELRLIIDAIASSKFITIRKSKDLIRKLEKMLSVHDAKLLEREVYVPGRVRNMNESIFYNVDVIQNAIISNHSVRFQYYHWNADYEMELKRDGEFYDISPWALVWDDENYYLVGYDDDKAELRHYRVDKMLKMEETDAPRKGSNEFKKIDKDRYRNMHFRMFGGEEESVTLYCSNSMANVIIDQFGRGLNFKKVDSEHFEVKVDVIMSDQFLSWVIALDGNVVIKSPEDARNRMRELLNKHVEEYC